MTKKMVVMDFDDTLYKKGICQEAIDKIKQKRAQGVIMGVLSGSPIENIIKKISGYDLMLDFIGSSNGALITEKKQNICLVSDERVLLLGELKEEFLKFQRYGKIIDTKYSIGLLTEDAVLKQDVQSMINNYEVIPSVWATGVSAVLITKYDSLSAYCKTKNIKPIVLAIGDSENDEPLFRFAKTNGGITALVGNGSVNMTVDMVARAPFSCGVAEILSKITMN